MTVPLPFTDEESFGLFMEGLRALQLYEDEAAQEHPRKAMLERGMEAAIACLRECVSRYSIDLLPRFYLAVALTMRNQEVYVDRLVELSEAYRALGRHLFFRDLNIGLTLTLPERRFAEQRARQESRNSTPFRDLSHRPWPLLEEASRQFRSLSTCADPNLRLVARYNLAQICSRRGDEFLQDGIDELGLSPPPYLEDCDLPLEPVSAIGRFADWVFPQKRKNRFKLREFRLRQWYEAQALSIQFDILRESLNVRLAIAQHPFDQTRFNDAGKSFEECRVRLRSENTDLDHSFKADLDADFCTKYGYIQFERALNPPTLGRNVSAADCLELAAKWLLTALELKEYWNPAQIYLAMVRRIQEGIAEANTEWIGHRNHAAIETVKGVRARRDQASADAEAARLALERAQAELEDKKCQRDKAASEAEWDELHRRASRAPKIPSGGPPAGGKGSSNLKDQDEAVGRQAEELEALLRARNQADAKYMQAAENLSAAEQSLLQSQTRLATAEHEVSLIPAHILEIKNLTDQEVKESERQRQQFAREADHLFAALQGLPWPPAPKPDTSKFGDG